ncbi:MAG: SemiSWEET transporter [Fimbriimonadaceae bacterium]|nr:SemiSWEET transporter [Chitinophagales bacterium]
MNYTTIVGVIASVFTAISLIPQLTKIIQTKKASQVSLTMLLILLSGLSMWIYYGILKEDLIIIISTSFSLTINLLILFFKIKYKRQ